MTGNLLHGCGLKLRRANTHHEALHEAIKAFNRSKPCSWADDRDLNTGEKYWYVVGDPDDPPGHIGPIVGDLLYNLRSALDHLAWQLVIVSGDTPDNRTAFPIFSDQRLFDRYGSPKLRGMRQDIRNAIIEHQPFHDPDHPKRQRLAWLEDLGNIDKHRHLNFTTAAAAGGFFDPPLLGITDPRSQAPVYVGAGKGRLRTGACRRRTRARRFRPGV